MSKRILVFLFSAFVFFNATHTIVAQEVNHNEMKSQIVETVQAEKVQHRTGN